MVVIIKKMSFVIFHRIGHHLNHRNELKNTSEYIGIKGNDWQEAIINEQKILLKPNKKDIRHERNLFRWSNPTPEIQDILSITSPTTTHGKDNYEKLRAGETISICELEAEKLATQGYGKGLINSVRTTYYFTIVDALKLGLPRSQLIVVHTGYDDNGRTPNELYLDFSDCLYIMKI